LLKTASLIFRIAAQAPVRHEPSSLHTWLLEILRFHTDDETPFDIAEQSVDSPREPAFTSNNSWHSRSDHSPKNVCIAIRAADWFGSKIGAIDIITPDIAVPWYDNAAISNEVNLSPLFGGEISCRDTPVFLQQFMRGDGKIPIDLFDGEMAMAFADARLIISDALIKSR
jgi:hypothetical protein